MEKFKHREEDRYFEYAKEKYNKHYSSVKFKFLNEELELLKDNMYYSINNNKDNIYEIQDSIDHTKQKLYKLFCDNLTLIRL